MSDKPSEAGDSTPAGSDRRRGRSSDPTPETPEAKAPDAKAQGTLPPIDFTTFLLSLGSTALVQMGAAPDPVTGQIEKVPELARETIDLLGLLREKTRGNLTDEEHQFLDALLYDLRMRFVEATRGT